MSADTLMLDEALSLAAQGLSVLPLYPVEPDRSCACRNPRCASVGKHPIRELAPNGLHNASVDAAALRQWWALWPDANLGIRTGAISGLVALDVDDRGGGWAAMAALEDKHGSLPDTWAVATGGGGGHLYFRHPGVRIGSSAGKLGPGLDIRGDDAYCVAPPSLHQSRKRYQWSGTLHPNQVPLADIPGWLLEQITVLPTSTSPALDEDEQIGEGQRNDRLFRLASAFRRYGLVEGEILAALESVNASRCRPPLPFAELQKIARSAATRYAPAGERVHGTGAARPRPAWFEFRRGKAVVR